MAQQTRRRLAAGQGRGPPASPTVLANSTGTVPATRIATRYTSGLAAAALAHSPWLRATVAVVMPQNGQGTPVSVRSGHGRPGQPVWATTAGYPAPRLAAPTANRETCSGTE